MNNFIKTIIPFVLMLVFTHTQAQKKATRKHTINKHTNKVTIKSTTREFGAPTSVSQIADITEASPAYESLKNLIEQYGVTITYADNTFKGKEYLKRGDFIVALNSAYASVKRALDAARLDTTIINTYDRNRGGAYLTSISQVKDVAENSIYYPAATALLEKWGVGAPFTLSKTLNPMSTISEKEVYDILRVTLGYNSAGVNPYSTSMSREKFAMALNAAVTQKMQVVADLIGAKKAEQARKDEEKRRLEDMLQQAEQRRKDSIAKEIEKNKIEAARREEEAKKKLKEKEKNPK